MSQNIVPIRPGVEPDPAPGEVNERTVEILTGLLEKARNGEIVGIGYVAQHPGRMTSFDNGGFLTRAALGAIMLLQHSMASQNLKDDE